MTKALAFSGGKDSLACWFLYRHEDPYVIWVNTGKAYPETLSIIEMVRQKTKRFVEVRTDQAAQNAMHGLPSEIVPIDWTEEGMYLTGEKPVRIQSYMRCCWENISAPLHNAAKQLGIEFLIRGQRIEEHHKSPARDGSIVGGITYLQPIERWSKDDVMRYLASNMEIPEHFSLDHSSMDCYDCTAFLAQSVDRAEWTRVRWPELHARYMNRLTALRDAIQPSISTMDLILNGGANA